MFELAGEPPVRLQPVKPCKRCPIPDIDPATGQSEPVVSAALQRYRSNGRLGGAVSFGMNLIIAQGVDQTLKVGQAVAADYQF
jgi:uncharacterized protein YcbX